MCSSKMSVFAVLVLAGFVSAAPKPFDFEEVGRKLQDFGQKALPTVRGVCGFVNAYQGYPPQGYSQGYPQAYPQGYHQGYPQAYPQGYPQGFPQGLPQPNLQYQNFFPQLSNTFPQKSNQHPRSAGGSIEQDDLSKVDGTNILNIPPPQIQDVFKNFDKLPAVGTKFEENTVFD